MSEQSWPANLVPPLTNLILEAGQAIMEIFESDFEILSKQDASPVTIADEKGEAIITKALASLTPHIPVIGEEAKSQGKAPDLDNATQDGKKYFWLVDPLDGTKEFIKRGTDFTVNIGLIEDGHPIMGLVYAPALGKIWVGGQDVEAKLLTVSDYKVTASQNMATRCFHPENAVIVASKSHRSPELESWLAHYPDAEHVSIGSSLKFCLVAEGQADLYPRLGPTCEWDTAAAHAVLVGAGGKVLDDHGQPLCYGKDFRTYLNPYFIAIGDPNLQTPTLQPVIE